MLICWGDQLKRTAGGSGSTAAGTDGVFRPAEELEAFVGSGAPVLLIYPFSGYLCLPPPLTRPPPPPPLLPRRGLAPSLGRGILLFFPPPGLFSCRRSISIRTAGSFMNSSGRSWTVRGGNKARRCCWNRWREERKREEWRGGVAVLLNFNEYQGEFLLRLFSCSLYILLSLQQPPSAPLL